MSDLIQFKVDKNHRYVVMELTAMETQTMSFKAKGIHVWFMSRPKDWQVNFENLVKQSTEGRAAIRSGLKELERHGYLTRETTRGRGGLFSTLYTVRETPIGPAGNTHHHPPSPTDDQGRLSNPVEADDQGRLSVGGSTVGGQSPRLIGNTEKVTGSIKHLGYAGTEVPVGADAPAHDLNPHAGHLREREQRKRTALEESARMPEAYMPIVAAWGDVATKHDPKTKIMANAKSLIRKARTGTLFKNMPDYVEVCRKYNVNQIIRAIERFGLMRNNPDYLPTNKQPLREVSLDRFFYSKFAANKSWFAVCVNGNGDGPMLAADADPELTAFVKEQYDERKGGKIDQSTITSIAAKLHRYWKSNRGRLRQMGVANEKTLVTRWISFVEQEFADWGPQHFLHKDIHHQFEKYVQR